MVWLRVACKRAASISMGSRSSARSGFRPPGCSRQHGRIPASSKAPSVADAAGHGNGQGRGEVASRFRSSPGLSQGVRSRLASGSARRPAARSRAQENPRPESARPVRPAPRRRPRPSPAAPASRYRPDLSSSSAACANRLCATTVWQISAPWRSKSSTRRRERIEIGIGLELAARAALALLGGLVDGQLVFQRQQDHAQRRHHLAHDDDAVQVEAELPDCR